MLGVTAAIIMNAPHVIQVIIYKMDTAINVSMVVQSVVVQMLLAQSVHQVSFLIYIIAVIVWDYVLHAQKQMFVRVVGQIYFSLQMENVSAPIANFTMEKLASFVRVTALNVKVLTTLITRIKCATPRD